MNFNIDTKGPSEEKKENLQVLCSGILKKDGKRIIYVRFEQGKKYAEGSIPQAKITSQSGFSTDEIAQFEAYLETHQEEILAQARTVNLMKNFMK